MPPQRSHQQTATEDPGDWLSGVARDVAAEAQAPVDLLGEYLAILSHAARTGQRPQPEQLAGVRRLGRRAAEQGVDADQAVDLYLTAAWRLWQAMPTVGPGPDQQDVRGAAEAVLRVVTDAVEVLVDGHQAARRELIRQEESTRREFVDDLLRGDADVARLVQRAEPFGLDLARPHQVLLAEPAEPGGPRGHLAAAAVTMERATVDRYGDREVLVATKDSLLVLLIPGETPAGSPRLPPSDPVTFVRDRLARHAGQRRWQVAVGRCYPGAYGIARSYEEAREMLVLAHRLRVPAEALQPRDLLVHRVLGRDQAALVDLVHALLEPLTRARGGPEPLLQTLETYFATGAVATETARRLHVSVRTVTYRLAKVSTLTGTSTADPDQRLALHLAVVGARLLGWPATPLPAPAGP